MTAIGNALANVQQQRAALPETSRAATPMPLGLHVLAVEDNPINRVILAEQLRTLGCDVELAQDGVEALQRCREQSFDLVVTDINMPRMDGHAGPAAARGRQPGAGDRRHRQCHCRGASAAWPVACRAT
jgi:two-component system capsular synthesis sensor histidine kinase RcsC